MLAIFRRDLSRLGWCLYDREIVFSARYYTTIKTSQSSVIDYKSLRLQDIKKTNIAYLTA
jgi:hypothetical protein